VCELPNPVKFLPSHEQSATAQRPLLSLLRGHPNASEYERIAREFSRAAAGQ